MIFTIIVPSISIFLNPVYSSFTHQNIYHSLFSLMHRGVSRKFWRGPLSDFSKLFFEMLKLNTDFDSRQFQIDFYNLWILFMQPCSRGGHDLQSNLKKIFFDKKNNVTSHEASKTFLKKIRMNLGYFGPNLLKNQTFFQPYFCTFLILLKFFAF